jgi:hypothetical protein
MHDDACIILATGGEMRGTGRDGSIDDRARAMPEQMRHQHVFVINGSVEFLNVVREVTQEERRTHPSHVLLNDDA